MGLRRDTSVDVSRRWFDEVHLRLKDGDVFGVVVGPYQRPVPATLLEGERSTPRVVAIDELERGREAYHRRAWLAAYEALSLADEATPLGAEDLELLATSACLIGRNDDGVGALDRAHHLYLDAGEPVCAARCAIWLGFDLIDAGEMSRATGWFSRARRLLERTERDCVERGYLLVPAVLQQMCPGEYETGYATAALVAEIGERFGDVDLIAFARQAQGRALVRLGRVRRVWHYWMRPWWRWSPGNCRHRCSRA